MQATQHPAREAREWCYAHQAVVTSPASDTSRVPLFGVAYDRTDNRTGRVTRQQNQFTDRCQAEQEYSRVAHLNPSATLAWCAGFVL